MNPSQKQAIEDKAEELYKIKESAFRDVDIIINISKARFIEGATFGLSFAEKRVAEMEEEKKKSFSEGYLYCKEYYKIIDE